jgi:hypothetical protein
MRTPLRCSSAHIEAGSARGRALGGIGLESRRSALVGSAGHALRRIRHERLDCEEARHLLRLTIDGRLGFPDVKTLLRLTDVTCHIPLIQRAVDGACTTQLELHSYDASAHWRNWRIGGARVPLLHSMLKKMRFVMRAKQSMEHSECDQCGASYALFTNLVLDWVLRPMLQNRVAFGAFAAVFPYVPKLVVDGVPQVASYSAKHVVSVPANNPMPYQAAHADPPSNFPRAIIVRGVTLSSSESSDFSARHEEGTIFSKNSVENVPISTPAGNRQRPDHARQAGHRRRRVPPNGRPGVRHDGRRICGWWEHRSCIARAACGRSGCRWVPGLLRARQLGESAHHAGAAAACSSPEGSLAFAGTGLMVAAVVSAAMAVFGLCLPSIAHGSLLRSTARVGTGPSGVGLVGALHGSSG